MMIVLFILVMVYNKVIGYLFLFKKKKGKKIKGYNGI